MFLFLEILYKTGATQSLPNYPSTKNLYLATKDVYLAAKDLYLG